MIKIFNKLNKIKFSQSKRGETVLHFTGSMFGIGCWGDDEIAVDKINKLKHREDSKGYILLIPNISWLDRFGISYSNKIKKILQQFWPGNLTVILNDENNNFSRITLDGKIAIRVPVDKLLRDFINTRNVPFLSTSINVSQEAAQYNLSEIKRNLNNWFDYGIVPSGINVAENAPSTIIKFKNNNLEYIRKGSIDSHLIENAWLKPKILFVCTGNTCRSPLAEYYTKFRIKEEKLNFRTASVGFVCSGNSMALHSSTILDELGIEHESHLSRIIELNDIKDSWLILTMAASHKKRLIEMSPESENRVFTLSEFCGKDFCQPDCDIDDPYGLDISFYRCTFDLIKERIDCLLKKISKEER